MVKSSVRRRIVYARGQTLVCYEDRRDYCVAVLKVQKTSRFKDDRHSVKFPVNGFLYSDYGIMYLINLPGSINVIESVRHLHDGNTIEIGLGKRWIN